MPAQRGLFRAMTLAVMLLYGATTCEAEPRGAATAVTAPQPPVRPAELSPPAAAERSASQIPEKNDPKDKDVPPAGITHACLADLQARPGARLRSVTDLVPSEAACAVVEPVIVEALPVEAGSIALTPAVTVSCEMATRTTKFLVDTVQPLARAYFGRDLVRLQVGGGHECRRRNRATNGPLSEHATGQALDIFAFVMGNPGGELSVSVERPEGPLQERFLSAVRQAACGAFMTSLGPGSDAAHTNHLHVDIQMRRQAASRFCQ